ncbi:MAG: ATP-binding protein [Pseudomonadota bacterium]
MAQSVVRQTLSPVIGAAALGVIAYFIGMSPVAMVVAACGGAALGALASLSRQTERAAVETDAGLANPQPVPTADETPTLQALEHLPFGLLIINGDRTILFANRMAGAMFGVHGGGDQPASTLRTRRLLDRIDLVFTDGKPSILNFTLSRMGDANLKAHLLPLDSGEVMIAIEDETQAQHAGAMHRDFVANASHELKTPLAAVAGIIETLLGHARNDPDATERFLDLLQAQTSRMTRLVEDLLSLNRIEVNERVQPEEPNDLLAVVSEMVDVLRPIADTEGVEIVTNLSNTKVWVLSDRDELGQLFGNLIDNAIKYGGAGTTVSIDKVEPTPEMAGMIGIAITDQGPGIAREHIPRLTERFYRVNIGASRAKGGTGLGLAIVKHILSRHRGRIEIESSLGEGSCFRVWLPVAKQPQAGKAVTNDPAILEDATRVS